MPPRRSVGLRDQGEPLGSDTYLNHGRMGHLAAARGAGWQRQQHRVPKQGVLRPRSIWRQRLRIQAHGFDNGVPSACSTQQTVCQLLSAAPIIESPGLCDEHCLLGGSDNLFILACVEVTIISRHVYRWALFLNDQGSGTRHARSDALAGPRGLAVVDERVHGLISKQIYWWCPPSE